jgi:hypothetical protein
MTEPPTDRHPRTRVTRLPYVVVAIVVLLAAAAWGTLTLRERRTADREMFGAGDDPARVEQAVTNPPQR